jgi:hypothetical protein
LRVLTSVETSDQAGILSAALQQRAPWPRISPELAAASWMHHPVFARVTEGVCTDYRGGRGLTLDTISWVRAVTALVVHGD